jgi:hypothetical protein
MPCETNIGFPRPTPGRTLPNTDESDIQRAAREAEAEDTLMQCDRSVDEYCPPNTVIETDPVVELLLTETKDTKAAAYPAYKYAEDRLPARVADEATMPNDRPDPDWPLHRTELADIQVDLSHEENPARIMAVTSAFPIPFPITVILFEPEDTMVCLTLDSAGALNVTARVIWGAEDWRATVTDTGANLDDPAEVLDTNEHSETHLLHSATLPKSFKTDDQLLVPKSRPTTVTYTAPESGALHAIDSGVGLL